MAFGPTAVQQGWAKFWAKDNGKTIVPLSGKPLEAELSETELAAVAGGSGREPKTENRSTTLLSEYTATRNDIISNFK